MVKSQLYENVPCVLFYNFPVTITLTRNIKDSEDKSEKRIENDENENGPINSF